MSFKLLYYIYFGVATFMNIYSDPSDGSTFQDDFPGKLSVQSGRRMSQTSGDASPGGGRERSGTTPGYNPFVFCAS